MNPCESYLKDLAKWLVMAIDSESRLDTDSKNRAEAGWVLSIRVLFIYALDLVIMTKWMAGRNPMSLGKFPTVWNTILSVCSAIGMLVVLPETFKFFWQDGGLQRYVCDLEQLKTPQFQGFIKYFCYLKLLQLGDSVLAVLEKKHLTYWHIYYHLSMMLAAHIAVYHFPIFRLLATSDLVINFLLYASLVLEDNGWISKATLNFIARLQALPRAIFLASSLYSFRMKYNGQACDVPTVGLIVTFPVALLYFVNFFTSLNIGKERRVSKRE